MTRKQALKDLLTPIWWHPGSSIAYRQAYVRERRQQVLLTLPFLTHREKALAKQWLQDERHEDLWD